jgi:hypothetical protein
VIYWRRQNLYDRIYVERQTVAGGGEAAFSKRFTEIAERNPALQKPINVANASLAYEALLMLQKR